MNITAVLLAGGAIGLLTGAGIFFEPREPYKLEIMIASTIRSILVAILIGFSLTPGSRWYSGVLWGFLYGFATGLVVFLAKGGFKSKEAPYVVPGAAVAG